jgi:hypothetical protein
MLHPPRRRSRAKHGEGREPITIIYRFYLLRTRARAALSLLLTPSLLNLIFKGKGSFIAHIFNDLLIYRLRLGSARLGSARLGSPRLGSPRLGSARLGFAAAAAAAGAGAAAAAAAGAGAGAAAAY